MSASPGAERKETRSRLDRAPAFAIVRVDTFQDEKTSWDLRVTVTRIVWDEETAREEVARLNDLNAAKGALYFYQGTRVD